MVDETPLPAASAPHGTCTSCGAATNTELKAALDDRQRVLSEMVDVQRALARRGPLQQKLDLVTQAVSRVLDADMVGIRLVDREHPDELVVRAGVGLDPETPVRSPVAGSGIGGAAFRGNTAVSVDDYGDYGAGMGIYRKIGVRAALAVPVQEFGRAVGSIVAGRTASRRPFEDSDRKTLLAFADQASIALTE